MNSPKALVPHNPHPRLFLSKTRVAELQRQVSGHGDAVSKHLYDRIKATADGVLPKPVLGRVMEGRRLLGTSRDVLSRVFHLGLVALISGDERYARRAIAEMLSAAAFEDWNPSHYLDTAEMTLALAVGYDWLYDAMTPGERGQIAKAITEKGLLPSLEQTESTLWWVSGHNNWNQVCHAGMVAGALTLADENPDLCKRLVARAIEKVPLAGVAYAPDGAYAEGTMYWGYGTGFHVMLIDMLTTALGDDGGLATLPGFLESARFIHETTGPSGKFFNYSDSREERGFSAPMFWFARRLDNPDLLRTELAILESDATSALGEQKNRELGRMMPLSLVWWKPEFESRLAGPAQDLPLNWRARGEVPLGIHRSAWHDPKAAFVALKGGCPAAPHGHMDGGVFIVEAGGVRWAADLGMQDYYSLEKLGVGLWDGRPEGGRWTVFRVGGMGHNILSFNGAPQILKGVVPLVRFSGEGEWPHTVVDLSAIYADHAARVWRGVSLGRNGAVIVQDEWQALPGLAVDVRWQMLTHAEVEVAADRKMVTLKQSGQEFVWQITGETARIEVIDASHGLHDFDAPNPGAKQVVIHLHTEAGESSGLRLVGTLVGSSAGTANVPAFRPLKDWSPVDPALAG